MHSVTKRWTNLFALGTLVVLCLGRAHSDDTTGPPVAILALNENGQIMVETELEFVQSWTSVGVGDPLTLTDFMPRSVVVTTPGAEAMCEDVDPDAAAACVNYGVVLKHPECQTNCHFPFRPVGTFFGTQFPDGGWVILRLLEGIRPATIEASYLGSRYALAEISPLDVARLQVFEESPEFDMSRSILENLVAYADCLSLIAYSDGVGQMGALELATDVVRRVEEHFYTVHGQYSHSLCQLYTGTPAVVGDLPRNPFEFDKNLCATEYSTPRPEGAIRYFPYTVGDTPGDERVVGYAIAILGPGEPADPPEDLPEDAAMPLRAVKWYVVRDPADEPSHIAETEPLP